MRRHVPQVRRDCAAGGRVMILAAVQQDASGHSSTPRQRCGRTARSSWQQCSRTRPDTQVRRDSAAGGPRVHPGSSAAGRVVPQERLRSAACGPRGAPELLKAELELVLAAVHQDTTYLKCAGVYAILPTIRCVMCGVTGVQLNVNACISEHAHRSRKKSCLDVCLSVSVCLSV